MQQTAAKHKLFWGTSSVEVEDSVFTSVLFVQIATSKPVASTMPLVAMTVITLPVS